MWHFEQTRRVALCSTMALVVGLSACAPQGKTGRNAQSAPSATASGESADAMSTDPEALHAQATAMMEQDPAQAALLFEGAALQGHGAAAYQLGLLQTDPKRRVEWHSMAASVGQVDAQYALGEAYLNGRGTAKEPAWGLSWFERAARAGHAPAQYAMGAALATGLAGSAMHEEALVWMLIAKKNGHADADLMVGFLQSRLSVSALAAVQARAGAWTNEPAGDAEARATTRFAQHALARLGFGAGLADGLRGERTDQAVSAFRKAQGLGEGGLDGRTLDLLRERVAVLNR